MSEETKKAMAEWKTSTLDTFRTLINTLAGEDTAKLFAEELEKALSMFASPYERAPGGVSVPGGSAGSGTDPDASPAVKSFTDRLKETVTGALGQAGTAIDDVVNGFAESNIVLAAVTSVVNALSGASINFAASLNFLDTIFTEMAAVIAPLVDELFAPVVPAVYDVLPARIRALRSKDQGW
jgi:hypothetical protein